jgi:hypothetical protein
VTRDAYQPKGQANGQPRLVGPAQSTSQLFEPPLSETPSTEAQAPEKFQISSPEPQKHRPGQTARRSAFSFELGASLEFGIWSFLPGLSAFQKL